MQAERDILNIRGGNVPRVIRDVEREAVAKQRIVVQLQATTAELDA